MGFWKRIEEELDFRGMSRKELSAQSGVPMTTINRAIERDSNPFAIDAVRIARVLGLSLENLLEIPAHPETTDLAQTVQHQLRLYKKYHAVIEQCERLSAERVKLLVTIAEHFEISQR